MKKMKEYYCKNKEKNRTYYEKIYIKKEDMQEITMEIFQKKKIAEKELRKLLYEFLRRRKRKKKRIQLKLFKKVKKQNKFFIV